MNGFRSWMMLAAALTGAPVWGAGAVVQSQNLFANPSFELRATEESGWHLDVAGATEASFVVNNDEAAEGDRSA